MYKVLLIALVAVAAFAPASTYAKTAPEKCLYKDRSGVHTGVLAPAMGDGVFCLDKKGKAHDTYVKPAKHVKAYRVLLDGRVVPL